MLVQEEFAERVVMEYESDVGSLGMVVALDFHVEMGERARLMPFLRRHASIHACCA